MKEIELSFTIRILPKQTDVHWIEEELLRIRGEVFLGVLKRVLEEIEEEVLGVLRECEICGLGMVRNGQALRRVKTLLGVVGLEWVRMRCPRCGQEIYPLDEAIGVLDIWHLEKELRWALGEESLGFIEELKGLAFQGKGSEIVQWLMREGARVGEIERRKKIMGGMTYVGNNLDWIANIPKVKGYGLGPVEKTVDITVARRLKKRGMNWLRDGANPLLKLRLLKLKGKWESYWA